jgi:aminopeptidase N
MLRRLVGDDPFFSGLRRFYHASKFQKVGAEEFRGAMEEETGMSLARFFSQWVDGTTLPRVKFSYRVDGTDVVLHAEQFGEIFELPLTVTLQYADRKTDVQMSLSEHITELRVPLTGSLRSADISRDDGPLAEIMKN